MSLRTGGGGGSHTDAPLCLIKANPHKLFCILTLAAVNLMFNRLRPSRELLIALGVLLALYIPLMVFIYYISDKIEKRNLELINQRLADESAKDSR